MTNSKHNLLKPLPVKQVVGFVRRLINLGPTSRQRLSSRTEETKERKLRGNATGLCSAEPSPRDQKELQGNRPARLVYNLTKCLVASLRNNGSTGDAKTGNETEFRLRGGFPRNGTLVDASKGADVVVRSLTYKNSGTKFPVTG